MWAPGRVVTKLARRVGVGNHQPEGSGPPEGPETRTAGGSRPERTCRRKGAGPRRGERRSPSSARTVPSSSPQWSWPPEGPETVALLAGGHVLIAAMELAPGGARDLHVEAQHLAGLDAAMELAPGGDRDPHRRSEEHTSELQSLMRKSYAVL